MKTFIVRIEYSTLGNRDREYVVTTDNENRAAFLAITGASGQMTRALAERDGWRVASVRAVGANTIIALGD